MAHIDKPRLAMPPDSAQKRSMITMDALPGLWRRSLLAWTDGRRDTTTQVHWLQGPSLYADLRQPEARPSFDSVNSFDDLDTTQIAWMARQEAFAGRLVPAGGFFEWHRAIDFQPPAALPDAGRLWLEDGMMKEEGRDLPYLEHWHHDSGDIAPCGALRLHEAQNDRPGLLVWAKNLFMMARGRKEALPTGACLADLIRAAPDLATTRALLDCEISLGVRRDGHWAITASSLPWKEDRMLAPDLSGDHLTTRDIDGRGLPCQRVWMIREREGDPLSSPLPA